ncbi:hypothetical protein [Janthinobacterium sp. B9-8]|uniref:hypothetical protein n=1 Tax=Janthinobacterium sp. B9-8 TaxID=1236179 RepID=UPI00061D080C|nr:hypothetical protein [Janthinobacterium sp. B9-8]AMC34237.1 hypothetical protein VN23_06320 [Janthinobacterium sp. B9-8]
MSDSEVPAGAGSDWTGFIQDIVGSAAKGYIGREFGTANRPYMVDPGTGQPYVPGQPTNQQTLLPAVSGNTGLLMMAAVGVVIVFLLVK